MNDLRAVFGHLRVKLRTYFWGGRRGGRVGALLFRTYSEQRARASPGQKFDENLGEKNSDISTHFAISVKFTGLYKITQIICNF